MFLNYQHYCHTLGRILIKEQIVTEKYRKAEYVQRCVPSSNVQVLIVFEVVLMHDA